MTFHNSPSSALVHDLGSFEGFNFRSQSAMSRRFSADEVISWDHDKHGEAEFWPAGDNPGVALVFRDWSSVCGSALRDLDHLLSALGGDSPENFLRTYFALSVCGYRLETLSVDVIEDMNVHVFVGTNFTDLRREAALELFELYYPDAYALWEKCTCDGLIFDTDRFLDSPSLSVTEERMGDKKALLVSPQ